MKKLQQRIDAQEHVLRCMDMQVAYHPRNENDKTCEVECLREFLKDGFFFYDVYTGTLTDTHIRDFIGWVRWNGKVERDLFDVGVLTL